MPDMYSIIVFIYVHKICTILFCTILYSTVLLKLRGNHLLKNVFCLQIWYFKKFDKYMFSSIPEPFLVLLSFLGRSVWHFWLVLYLNYSTSLISVFLGLIIHIMWFGHIFALYNFEAQDFLLYLYSIESAICRPSNSTVGRPRRAEIRTRDGRLYRICFLPLYVHFTPQVFVY